VSVGSKYLTYTVPASRSKPVGVVRHASLRLLGTILQGGYAASYESEIVASRVVPLALSIFFDHPHVYFAHQVVADLVMMPLLHGSSLVLLRHLLIDAGLLESIMSRYEPPHSARSSDASTWSSYNGFLTNIADSINSCRVLTKCSSVPADIVQRWKAFSDSQLHPSEF